MYGQIFKQGLALFYVDNIRSRVWSKARGLNECGDIRVDVAVE